MKKLLSILLLTVMLFTLVACGGGDTTTTAATTTTTTGPQKVYEKVPKQFSSSGMKITLTDAFIEATVPGYTVCYDSSDVAVVALKESFSLLAGLSGLSVEEYADLVHQSNASKSPTAVTKLDGLTVFEYDFLNTDLNQTYSYLTVMYKGSDAFWTIQFSTLKGQYTEYRPYLINWAKTVNVTGA